MSTDLAAIAIAEFRSLQAGAPAVVAAGKVSRAEAERRLRCWLAMAVRLGGDPDTFVITGRAELRLMCASIVCVHPPGGTLTEAELRRTLADDIAPREAWAAELAGAIDDSIANAALTRADALLRLARHFDVTATLRRAEPDRKAA